MRYLQLIPVAFFLIVSSGMFTACNQGDKTVSGYKTNLVFNPGDETKIIEALLTLKDSTSVYLKQGTYHFDNLSIARVNHIELKGDGPDKTILDFSKQSTGGEGIRVTNSIGFSISGMTIRESKGDLIKVNGSRDVTFLNLHAIWAKSDSTSGGYAIYPVLCKNVLVEKCYVQGSSDAGIYVGQTDSAIVKNCSGRGNVAGCELENTTHAAVYDNEFFDNTAGILVFDLPDLSQRGGFVKVYNNNLHDNNHRNFAKAGSFGTAWGVGNAPPGSGIVVLAASNVEIYNNKINNNNSAAIILASGFAVDDHAAEKMNEKYDPLSKNIRIYGNELSMSDSFPAPAFQHHMGQVLIATEQQLNKQFTNRKSKRIPFIVYDGFSSNILTNGTAANPDSLCIDQTQNDFFVNADFLHVRTPEKWKPDTSFAQYKCK